jgi:hypothetical protein
MFYFFYLLFASACPTVDRARAASAVTKMLITCTVPPAANANTNGSINGN